MTSLKTLQLNHEAEAYYARAAMTPYDAEVMAREAMAGEAGRQLTKSVAALMNKRQEAPVAHTNVTGYDQVTLDLLAKAGLPLAPINKSAPGGATMGDASWSRVLAVHAAAAAGDPVAERAWAAYQALDPGAARLIPQVVSASRPGTVTKSKKRKRVTAGAAPPAFIGGTVTKTGTGGRVTTSAPDDADFAEFVLRAAPNRSAAFKAIGSHEGDTGVLGSTDLPPEPGHPDLAHLDNDPEFQAYAAQQRARLGIRR
ncbi:MAG: hypothetical protein WAL12_21005 [Trebonia sp.]